MRPLRSTGGVPTVLVVLASLLIGLPATGAAGREAAQAVPAGALAAERIFLHDQNRVGPLDQVLAAVRGTMGEDDPLRAALLARLAMSLPDQFLSETGAPAGGEAARLGADIRSVVLAFGPLQVQVEFLLAGPPVFAATSFVIAFKLPAYDGPEIPMGRWHAAEDATIVARFHGMGNWTLRAAVLDGEERAIPGAIAADRATVRIQLPIATIAGLSSSKSGSMSTATGAAISSISTQTATASSTPRGGIGTETVASNSWPRRGRGDSSGRRGGRWSFRAWTGCAPAGGRPTGCRTGRPRT